MKTKKLGKLRSPSVTAGGCALAVAGVLLTTSFAPGPTHAETRSPVAIQDRQVVNSEVSFLTFTALLEGTNAIATENAMREIRNNWSPALIPQLLETVRFSGNRQVRREIFQLLREKTGEDLAPDFFEWNRWLWQQPELITEDYDFFKASLYSVIDPRFGRYFDERQETATIRLDEIVWGGVLQDGIPPLRQPEMLQAHEAEYLEDDHIVFGIVVNGDAHAYPKRILAWHEMFVNTIGGIEIAGVYCTLCGTVIPYRTHLDGKRYELGTSGFLYRSNKLMYDRATQSLWNTFQGEPVVGPLVGQGIQLERESVITTTWGNWKKRHPKTKVLSLETGHRRDYGEGVAYQDYFATDELMFNTPFDDRRLKNKQEVVALRFTGGELAIDTGFLAKNPVYSDSVGFQDVLVVTDTAGSSRVYDPMGISFSEYDGNLSLIDSAGVSWTVEEDQLKSADGRKLARLPSHRAFWFGWHASFPTTRLVK